MMTNGMTYTGLRCNDDAMKNQRWYQNYLHNKFSLLQPLQVDIHLRENLFYDENYL
jgi:hypothetical protein